MKTNSFSAGRVCDVGRERAFFISANGYDGFRTWHDDLYRSEEFERVFVILGGPGTGKSSLMRKVAEAGEAVGAECEYIYCSSDPQSLDGILLTKGVHKIAMLDGTAPHERGAPVPGAIDEFVHLGECWSAKILTQRRQEILQKKQENALCYQQARRYLTLAGAAAKALDSELDIIMDQTKLQDVVARELRSIRKTPSPYEKQRYISACGMNGVVRFNTLAQENEVVCVSDECGGAHRYLNEMRRQLCDAGCYGFWSFPSCFDDKKIEGVYLPQNKRLYLTNQIAAEGKKINIKRFVIPQKEVKERIHIRRFLRVREEMIRMACQSLAEAGARHFELEEIYGTAMDFTKKEKMTYSLCNRIRAILCAPSRD